MSEKEQTGNEIDQHFFERADQYINAANEQLADTPRGQVSASMLFGVARFNAWVSACEFESGEALQNSKDEIKEYFVKEYETMLEENLKDYITYFDKYMKPAE